MNWDVSRCNVPGAKSKVRFCKRAFVGFEDADKDTFVAVMAVKIGFMNQGLVQFIMLLAWHT